MKFPILESLSRVYSELNKKQKGLFFVLLGAIVVLTLLFMSAQSKIIKLEGQNALLGNKIQKIGEELLSEKGQVISLENELAPFNNLARRLHPDLETESGLAELITDFDVSRKIIARYEYIPLSPEKRSEIVESLRNLKTEFRQNQIFIEVSYEVWVSAEVKKLADELAGMLSEAELNVSGPDFKAVYQPGGAYTLEWGYSPEDEVLFQHLYLILKNLIPPTTKHAKVTNLPKGAMRIHFAGQVQFDSSGAATVY